MDAMSALHWTACQFLCLSTKLRVGEPEAPRTSEYEMSQKTRSSFVGHQFGLSLKERLRTSATNDSSPGLFHRKSSSLCRCAVMLRLYVA